MLSLNLVTPSFPDPIGAASAPLGAPTLNSQDPNLKPARVASFSLGLEHEFPHLKENILAAMGNIEPGRLLDTRFLDLKGAGKPAPEHFPIMND